MVNSKKKLTAGVNKEIKARFAERMNVSRAKVTQWDNDGRLVKEGKFVLIKESKERIKKTGHLNGWANEQHAARERADINEKIEQEKTLDDLKVTVNKTQLDLETDNAKELYENSRALREKATALQAAAEHEKFKGSLVEKQLIEKLIFERGRQFRDGLMTCSRRIAPEISGKDDIKEIEAVLSREFRLLLEGFTKLPVIE